MVDKKLYQKEYYENNREKILKKVKNYNSKNKEKRKEWVKKYRKEHENVVKEYRKKYYINNKNEILINTKKNSLLRKYNKTIEQYNEQVKEQTNLCYICHMEPNGRYKKLMVDHDHETNETRKLLCHNCNVALGLLKEDPQTISNMLLYVEFYDLKRMVA
jgi:hypothetical protein